MNFNKVFENMMQSNQLDTVILLAHRNPDGDAAGSVLGLAHYIKDVYPQYIVLPYLSELLDKGPKMLAVEDEVFCPFDEPQAERYGVIVCDTATKARIIGEEYFDQATASIVIDHHAANEGYGEVNEVKISEACAENLYYALDWESWKKCREEKQKENHPNAADYIYMGLMHDTGRFTRASVSVMEAALGLMKLGAEHKYVMKTMQTDTLDDLLHRGKLFSLAKKALQGQVAYIFLTKEECEKYEFCYEDIHPISGFLRDCEDVQMAFTIFEEEPGIWRGSFRSDGKWINVNELMKPFGGGGHAAAAGLRKKTDQPEKLLEDILDKIEQMRQNL